MLPGGARAVRGDRGMVVSVEPNATRAGVRMLESGGNAVDAAVAVAYALAVTHPSAGNIGGGGFMLVKVGAEPTVAVDFRERAPAAITRDQFDAMIRRKATGPESVGVPGSVAGMNLAHRKWGRLPLKDVMAPAIELARRGHRIGKRQAQTLQWSWPQLRRDRAAREIFGAGDKPKPEGAQLVQSDLARTLERIAAQGDAGFYAGETAAAVARAMKRGGYITESDLASYRAIERAPLSGSYRGLRVEVAPPPSAGGVAILQMLGLLERLDAHRAEAGSAGELHLLVESARRAHATRRFDVVEPESVPGYDLAKKRAEWLDIDRLIAREPRIDRARATPSGDVHPLFAAAMKELEHATTTHFSVVDADGNTVSCTTTLSAGFGAKFVVAGTGVVMNNSLAAFGTAGADQVSPGRRMTSSMAPTLVFRGNDLMLVLGTPGGDTIPNTVVQVLRHLVDHQMTLDLAIDAPRVHHGFAPDEIRYERARPVDKAVRKELAAMGHTFSKKLLPIGDANNILLDGKVAWGYPDPREGGLALGPAPAPN